MERFDTPKIARTEVAYWIGKCPVKGCNSRLHIEVPMTVETWTSTNFNHACGFFFPKHNVRRFPTGRFSGWHPYHLELYCAAHKRQIAWNQVNGTVKEDHVCDSRCLNAHGPNCDCACGGANHGRANHVNI